MTPHEPGMPEQAVSSADDQPMFQGRFASIANELDLGDEYFWTPNRLEPFEHWIGHIPFIFWLMKTGLLNSARIGEIPIAQCARQSRL